MTRAIRLQLFFILGFNLAVIALSAWGYAVTKQGAFAATGLACVICGATASALLWGGKNESR